MRSVASACVPHHSSASAPAQVRPGNTAHTAAWHSRRHLSTDGKAEPAEFFHPVGLRQQAAYIDKLPDEYEVVGRVCDNSI